MPEYGEPIENDLNFKPILDLFRGKKGKQERQNVASGETLGGTTRNPNAFDDTPRPKSSAEDMSAKMARKIAAKQKLKSMEQASYPYSSIEESLQKLVKGQPIEKVDARAIGRGIVGGLRGEKESPYKEGLTRGLPEGDVDPETGKITDRSYGEQHSLIPFTGKGEEQYPQYRQGYRAGKTIRNVGEDVARVPKDAARGAKAAAREAATGYRWGRDFNPGQMNRAAMEDINQLPGIPARIGEIVGRATRSSVPGKEEITRRSEPPLPKEGSVEKSLLKLMKDGDTQELNPMEDPPKENEESQALVADGDSKRPKSEVGTNDKMFKKEHERTPEEEKEIYVQRQINQRNAPGEHPEISSTPEKTPEWHEGLPDDHVVDGFSVADWKDFKRTPPTHRTPGKSYAAEHEPDVTRRNYPQDPSTKGAAARYNYQTPDGPVEEALLKLMKIEEPRSRQAMETEFPVRHPEGSYDPSIRVSRRSSMDRPTTPDPTQPPIDGEEVQEDWDEAGASRRSKHGKPSGLMGRRLPNYVSDEKFSGGAPEGRKIPIGKDDMEKGGTFWGGSRKQNVPQSLPKTEPPWNRQQNEPSQTAGVERTLQGFRQKPPKGGNLGEKRGQRKSIEESLIKIMKEGNITPSKVGMPRNAVQSLDKAPAPYQAPQMQTAEQISSQNMPQGQQDPSSWSAQHVADIIGQDVLGLMNRGKDKEAAAAAAQQEAQGTQGYDSGTPNPTATQTRQKQTQQGPQPEPPPKGLV